MYESNESHNGSGNEPDGMPPDTRGHWMRVVRVKARQYVNRVVVSEPESRAAAVDLPNVVALRARRPTHFSLIGGCDVLGLDEAWDLAGTARARWIRDGASPWRDRWQVHLELRRTDVSRVVRWYQERDPAAMIPHLYRKCREELSFARRGGMTMPVLAPSDLDDIAFTHLGMRVLDERIGDVTSRFEPNGLPRYRIDVMWQAHVPYQLWDKLRQCPDLYWPSWDELKSTAKGHRYGHSEDHTRVLCDNVYFFKERCRDLHNEPCQEDSREDVARVPRSSSATALA